MFCRNVRSEHSARAPSLQEDLTALTISIHHIHVASAMAMIRLVRAYSTKFVKECPPPTYDTGCTHCGIPTLPADKPINFEHKLNGTTQVPWKHVLAFSHGVDDFDKMASKINLIPGSLAQDFEVLKRKMISPMHPVVLSNALVKGINTPAGQTQKVRVYPDGKEVEFALDKLPEFIALYLLPDTPAETEVYNPFKISAALKFLGSLSPKKATKPSPDLFKETSVTKDLVLICGHTQRDIRCGLLAPVLKDEFVRVLEKENLHEQVDVGLISHIGGHAYAGNVLYFPKDHDLPVVWYGRVFPDRVQGIVQETIVKRNIIQELYRGEA